MIIQIDIPDGHEVDMLNSTADANNTNPVDYATSLVRSWLQARLREYYVGEVVKLTDEELKVIVETKKSKV